MEYRHQHTENKSLGSAFKTGIAVNIIFIVLEVFYGFFSNSMALIADAGHNFSDVLALGFSWLAIRLSQRRPTLKFTYGFRRSTILAAILNTIFLLAAIAFILRETIQRIGNPQAINSEKVIIVAAVGILVNGFTAWLFAKDNKKDLNIRSAFLHFIADTLVSSGVVVAGIIIALTGITWIDSVVSLIIATVILYSTYRLLIDSVSLALDAVPEDIDIKSVTRYLNTLPGVSGIHDLHIWALSTSAAALTVHLQTNVPTDYDFIRKIRQDLNDRFGIEHSTIQIEFLNKSEPCNDCN